MAVGASLRLSAGVSLPLSAPAPTSSPAADVFKRVDIRGPWWGPVVEKLRDLWAAFLTNLPLIVIGLALFLTGLVVAGLVARGMRRAMRRSGADLVAEELALQIARGFVVILFLLLALSVAGVNVGAALAGLGIVGLAVAFAVQNILENFISGVLLLIRKPFRAGDQIRTGEFEGTVEDIDFRVTRILTYDGEVVLIPNAEVFRKAIINLTRRGRRRTTVCIGVDYRDDHDTAREIIRSAVEAVPGVLQAPEPEVLLTELGDSSVDFEVRFWTLPDIRSVRSVQDRVLAAAKSAIEAAGMTIPWPIRTLYFDNPVAVESDGQTRADDRARRGAAARTSG